VHAQTSFSQNQFKSKGVDLIKLTKKVEEQIEVLAKLKEEHNAVAKECRSLEAKPTDDDLPSVVQELTARFSNAGVLVHCCPLFFYYFSFSFLFQEPHGR
jgi:putative IMPACT (imprinted ancient) family translation regulator